MDKNYTKNFIIVGSIGGALLMLFFAKMMYDMVGYVSVMSHEMVKMSNNIKKLDISVSDMDTSIQEMHRDIHDIQKDISKDMSQMSINMQSMDKNIHKGTKTFTSPQGFMKSFIP